MKIAAATTIAAATIATVVQHVSADDQLMCVDEEHTFNICLNVNGLPSSTLPSFAAARDRWDAAIDGDLESTALSGIDDKFLCNPHPSRVDDVYVCAKGVTTDGEGGIVGHALIPYHRRTRSLVTRNSHDLPLVGYMEIDMADAQALSGPSLTALLEHELGHMVGVHGYFWSLNGILDMQTGAYHGGNAIREWQAKGCLGFPPLDREGSDWYEGAFHYEIMGDSFTACGEQPCPLSTVTLGALQDMGHEVKYSAADPHYVPYCETENGPSISEMALPPPQPMLSELKREKAIRYGQAILEQNAKEAPQQRMRGGPQRITYSADLFVNGKCCCTIGREAASILSTLLLFLSYADASFSLLTYIHVGSLSSFAVFVEEAGNIHSITVKPGPTVVA